MIKLLAQQIHQIYIIFYSFRIFITFHSYIDDVNSHKHSTAASQINKKLWSSEMKIFGKLLWVPCHLMTLWEWKQALTDDWTHISPSENNKKDGTQPHHDDDDNVVVVDVLVFFSRSPSCDVTKTKWQMKLMISRLLMLGLLLLMILLPLEAS